MKGHKTENPAETMVFIENEQESVDIDSGHIELLKKTVSACLDEEGISTGCEINIVLTDDKTIRQFNKKYRNIDTPTDVISFPLADMKNGKLINEEGDYNIDEGLLLLGDIVISAETALRQAGQYGHSFERELAFLTAHGVYHLLGYDHMESCEETVMMSKQEAALEKLGLKRK
ncbi:MAG: rRNA maturation RNase YbeY [Acetivibrionales bacterium]|jgi:probable rRNA maturation factor